VPKNDAIEMDGTVVDALPNTQFKIKLDNGHELLAYTGGKMRKFRIRLALGSQPRHLLRGVIAEGTVMAAAGVLAGAAFGFVVARLAGSYFPDVKIPGPLPVVLSALVLLTAAVVASTLPAARAARIDVIQALRSE